MLPNKSVHRSVDECVSRELAATGEALVATHLSFPSVCHVAVAGNAFRWVPAFWDY
jgi:hypothetical protein